MHLFYTALIKLRIAPLAVMLTWILAGCQQPLAPEFKSIGNLELEMAGLDKARVTGDAFFYNPNKNAVHIRDVDIDVYLDSEKVAAIKRTIDVTAEGLADFTVPLQLDVALKDLKLNSIGAVLELLTRKERELRYLGKVRVKARGIPFSVPVDYTEMIELGL